MQVAGAEDKVAHGEKGLAHTLKRPAHGNMPAPPRNRNPNFAAVFYCDFACFFLQSLKNACEAKRAKPGGVMKSLCKFLIMLFCLNGAIFAHQLEIQTLLCIETEDNLGDDECELRIFVDGAFKEKLQKDLNRGKAWNINKTYSFNNVITVELWDLDSPDDDDHLGTLNIASPQSPVAKAAARLSRDGAKYELAYAVNLSQTGSPKVKAKNLLRAFSENTKPGKFTKINKNELIIDMSKRIENPTLISQSSQALCGPCAIIYLLIKINPERYVEFARDLYMDGQYRMKNGKIIRPGNHLYTEAVPKGISPADWMMSASMRDAANILFDFDPDDQFAGITLPGEMGGWMEGLLGCKQIEVNTTFLYGEVEALKASEDAIASGNVSVLCVDSSLVPGQKADSFNIANHWVVLLSVEAAGKSNKLKIWSWAKEYNLNLNEDKFEDFMWGTVIGYF
jgi:hypothetical protein